MREPVDHILRPRLPWRRDDEGAMTECGYDATLVKTLTREEYRARYKELGQQRTAMLTCMTCASTSERHGAWSDDPREAVQREIVWEGSGRWSHNDRGTRLREELIAIAELVEAHRDEFAEIITRNERQREWLEKKATLTAQKQAPKPAGSRPL